MAGVGAPGREGTPILTVVADGCQDDGGAGAGPASLIDEIVREGARRMLAEALQAEVEAYIAAFAGERGEDGRRLVVRNGYREPRTVLTSAGAVEVTAPRVNDRRTDPATGERARFSSAILPAWARKTPQVTEVLPLLYLHGLSTGDFVPALAQFLGSGAGPVRPGDHQADRDMEGRGRRVRRPGPVRRGLRLPVGRRHPPGHPPRRGQAVPAGDDRGARRLAARSSSPSPAGTASPPSRGPTCCGLRPPRDARPGPGRRRRGTGVLDRGRRGVPAGQGPALLVPQDRQRTGRAAQVRAPRGVPVGGDSGPLHRAVGAHRADVPGPAGSRWRDSAVCPAGKPCAPQANWATDEAFSGGYCGRRRARTDSTVRMNPGMNWDPRAGGGSATPTFCSE